MSAYIPGKIFNKVEKKILTLTLMFTIGKTLGEVDKELMASLLIVQWNL